MSEITVAALTAFFGVSVFVLGQFVQKFILEPIQEQRRVIGEIAFVLVYWANAGDGNTDERKEAHETIRRLAGQLRATLSTIPFYKFLAFLNFIPKKDAVLHASSNLIGWSNSIYVNKPEVAYDKRQKVTKALKIGWSIPDLD